VADAEDFNLSLIIEIEHDVSSVAEWNDQFSMFMAKLRDRAPSLRKLGQLLNLVSDDRNGTSRRPVIFERQKAEDPLHILLGARRPS
jgi:DNA gyrase/topoisomerase IV subunit A